jgi:hypothetical protein
VSNTTDGNGNGDRPDLELAIEEIGQPSEFELLRKTLRSFPGEKDLWTVAEYIYDEGEIYPEGMARGRQIAWIKERLRRAMIERDEKNLPIGGMSGRLTSNNKPEWQFRFEFDGLAYRTNILDHVAQLGGHDHVARDLAVECEERLGIVIDVDELIEAWKQDNPRTSQRDDD